MTYHIPSRRELEIFHSGMSSDGKCHGPCSCCKCTLRDNANSTSKRHKQI
ncbi:unnamed protein product, partial [Vitis vinifera]|uniref:Uncharacterized protein n=1 Tax=Vitis vinifera TaxID=29760 RepID=D7SLJ0_VITVI